MTDPVPAGQPTVPLTAELVRPQRPTVVWVAANLVMVLGALGIAFVIVYRNGMAGGTDYRTVNDPGVDGLYLLQFILSGTLLVNGLRVLFGRGGANWIAATIVGLDAIAGVIALVNGDVPGGLLSLVVNGGLLVLLASPGVRRWCT